MKNFISAFVFSMVACGMINSTIINPPFAVADDIDKILRAKEIVRSMVNYPDTLVFHEFSTVVKGNVVTLKFSCKNGFGVSETHTLDVNVN